MRVIAIVGMPGSGKTEAVKQFEKQGISSFNMGDVVTRIEPAKRGITKLDAYTETEIRMDIRKKLGPAAVAIITAEDAGVSSEELASMKSAMEGNQSGEKAEVASSEEQKNVEEK